MDEDCTEQCVCQANGTASCMPLCASVEAFVGKQKCKAHQKMAMTDFKLPRVPRCSCPVQVCYNDSTLICVSSYLLTFQLAAYARHGLETLSLFKNYFSVISAW